MALSKSVVKKSVEGNQTNINIITFTLAITDTNGVGFTQDFSIEYRKGDNIASKTSEVISNMQSAIDNYKSCQAIFNSTGLNNAVNDISGGLNV
jgi:hypothetical protein